MNQNEILEAIRSLSHSQGFYGRLLRDIEEDEMILIKLEEQNFKDVLEMVLFLEC